MVYLIVREMLVCLFALKLRLLIVGLFALKKAKTALAKWGFFVAALAVLMATAMVAVTKQPLF